MGINDNNDIGFCGNCGARAEKSNRFCTGCGEILDSAQNMEQKIQTISSATVPNKVYPHPTLFTQFPFQYNPVHYLYNTSNLLSGVKEAYSQKFSSIIIMFGSFYIAISILGFFILNIIITAYNLDSSSNDPFTQLLFELLISVLVVIIISVMQFMPNSFLYRIIDNLEMNRVEELKVTIRYCVSKWPNYILLGFVNLALLIGAILLIVGAFIIDIALGGLLLIPMLFLSIYISLKLVSSPAYIIIDGMSVNNALYASWTRMKGRLGSYFLASLIIGIIGSIISSFVNIPLSILIGDIGLIGLFIVPAFGQIFIGPLKSLLIISVYYLIKISQGETQTSRIFGKFRHYP